MLPPFFFPLSDAAIGHYRAVQYFTESIINETAFCAVRCRSYQDFKAKTGKCKRDDRLRMGEYSER